MKEFKTKDIFEASWLHSSQMPLSRLEPDSRYFWFVFNEGRKCEELSSKYWSQKAIGNIKEYVNSYKTLKDMVFSRN